MGTVSRKVDTVERQEQRVHFLDRECLAGANRPVAGHHGDDAVNRRGTKGGFAGLCFGKKAARELRRRGVSQANRCAAYCGGANTTSLELKTDPQGIVREQLNARGLVLRNIEGDGRAERFASHASIRGDLPPERVERDSLFRGVRVEQVKAVFALANKKHQAHLANET